MPTMLGYMRAGMNKDSSVFLESSILYVAGDLRYGILLQQEHLGYSAEELEPLNVRESLPEPASRQLPAHNGFGSMEDSAQNCISLVRAAETFTCILLGCSMLSTLTQPLQSARAWWTAALAPCQSLIICHLSPHLQTP